MEDLNQFMFFMGETGLPGIYFWNKNSFGDQINRLIAEAMGVDKTADTSDPF